MNKNNYHKKQLINKDFEEVSFVKWKDTPGDQFFFSLRAYGETFSRKSFQKIGKTQNADYEHIAIEFIEEGELSAMVDGKTFHLRKNDLIFYSTGRDVNLRTTPGTVMLKKYVNIQTNRFFLHLFNISDGPFFVRRSKNPERIRNIFQKIKLCVTEESETQASDLSTLVYNLIYDFWVMENRSSILPDTFSTIPQTLSISPEKYKDLKSIMAEFHITRHALTKLFRDRYNTTPIAYLIQQKLYKACWYLENTITPINEIAHLCGFNNIPLFTRQFKKQFLLSPGSYRKKMQKK